MTTVLLLDSGGRERVLGRTLVANPSVQLHATPENPGLAGVGTLHAVGPSNPAAVVVLTRRVGTDPTVVGPGASLMAGVTDAIQKTGINCFDPSVTTAELEGSKAFARDAMRTTGVPTVSAHVYATPGETAAALDAYGSPYAVKSDGLAAGKGVAVIPDRVATLVHAEACGKMVTGRFLDGPELSLFAICDGIAVVPPLPAQDFKRVGDGDAGLNTGGTGAHCPLPWVSDGLVGEVMTRVITPMLTEMRRRGTPFTGLLYAGLASTTRGVRVVEFSVHFGDPETQAILALLEISLAGVLRATSHNELTGLPPLRWRDGATMVVAEVAWGYPGTPVGGGNINLSVGTDHT